MTGARVKMMKRAKIAILPVVAALLVACGDVSTETPVSDAPAPADAPATADAPASAAPEVTFTPEESAEMEPAAKPGGPVTIRYRIVGKPVVGQPVAIDLDFKSNIGSRPIIVSYGINDSTALKLSDAQPRRVSLTPDAERKVDREQVTVIPQREGRLYLNVTAQVETDTGTMSTVTAVPIQVGSAPKTLQEQGTVTTDEEGELIRSLPGSEN